MVVSVVYSQSFREFFSAANVNRWR